ncbi:Disrupted in schizophrenia 1 protein [Anas platyrhynchos]|uniref:Disrupted in schizophrenia 1 protein n=1 Tax=Anas platyrhynchos TaxID=8839 RepID=R0JKQ2_ANAPL|nr:Disrupted in schizophrenia 1 protein [Anas platyrhynchos]
MQKEIEDLRARLAVLEAKDQQLRREIEEQDRLIQSQDCELTALLGCVSLRELQEISKAVDDTLASSYQIPFSLDLPGTIKSLQEKEQSFSTSIKETTAKVCTSQKLCSTLRRKVSDIETQLPALLEAKMLAVSGSNFGTAKDLTEEIRSLTSEKEGLEGLLNELQVLSARNIRKLERIKDDYNRLKQELEQGETAFGFCITPLFSLVLLQLTELQQDKFEATQMREFGVILEVYATSTNHTSLDSSSATTSSEV